MYRSRRLLFLTKGHYEQDRKINNADEFKTFVPPADSTSDRLRMDGRSGGIQASGTTAPHRNARAVFNIKDELQRYEESDAEEVKPETYGKKDERAC